MGPYLTETLLHNKGHHHSEKSSAFRMEKDRGIPSKICKELAKVDIKKINKILKWGTYLNKMFSKDDTQMAEKHLTFLPIREIKLKTPLRLHLTLIRMTKINKTNNIF